MIWQDCQGARHIGPIQGLLHRLVESQEHIATMGYVDTLQEQSILESLLDTVKPAWPAHSDRHHYLLRTPFRYPPLPWGSRFGGRHEPSLLYGGLSQEATLAEAAFYRFVFRASMTAPPPADSIRSQHTLWSASYRSALGVRLQMAPFNRHVERITHPADYSATQALGADMRAAGVEAFEYPSARDREHRLCVGLFTPQALAGTRPRSLSPWLCELGAREVAFKPVGGRSIMVWRLEDFLVDGRLPLPA